MDKLYRPSRDDIFTQFCKREAGFSAPRNFSRRVSASEVYLSFISVCYWVHRIIDSSFAFGNSLDFDELGRVFSRIAILLACD